MVGNGTALKIRNIAFADTGAYMCQATNIGKKYNTITLQKLRSVHLRWINERHKFFGRTRAAHPQ